MSEVHEREQAVLRAARALRDATHSVDAVITGPVDLYLAARRQEGIAERQLIDAALALPPPEEPTDRTPTEEGWYWLRWPLEWEGYQPVRVIWARDHDGSRAPGELLLWKYEWEAPLELPGPAEAALWLPIHVPETLRRKDEA